MRLVWASWFSALMAGCAATPAATRAPGQAPPSSSDGPALRAQKAPVVHEQTDLRAHFEAEQATGTIALFDSSSGSLTCSDVAACQRTVLPASTFKIPNALIALELGVVEDSETLIQWDGQPRVVTDWNQDHTLRTAMRVSCVPCFQWIARSVGTERMKEWVQRFDYGNRDISGGIDRFWLTGALRISPIQQIDFLRRLEGEKLGVGHRSMEILRDILALDVGQSHVFRGKTGLSRPPESKSLVGWFVGWVEIDERRIFFATLVDGVGPEVDILPLRRRLTERILRAENALPS